MTKLEQTIYPVVETVPPSITPTDIEANIASEQYLIATAGSSGLPDPYPDEHGLITFCVLELKNGCTVTGQSDRATCENFNAELSRKIARENAIAKIWPPAAQMLPDVDVMAGSRSRSITGEKK